ncbi:hypothetical protein [Litorimonas sp. WD9-15]|uniref:hypothetical protein n=1 Tax=Litorimonas sp. WD9-15 TaxID=3418716 RepID=UPI003D05D686
MSDRITEKKAKRQLISFILVKDGPFHHATRDSAARERDFLQAKKGKSLRIMRVLNVAAKDLPAVEAALAKLNLTPEPPDQPEKKDTP